jgi:hypothetical protein
MKQTAASEHLALGGLSDQLREAPHPASAHLTQLENLSARSLFSGDLEVALQEVEALAAALSSPEATATRRELVSRELAIAHAQANGLHGLLGSLVRKKETVGAQAPATRHGSSRR